MNGELFNLNLGDLLASEVPTKISELEQSSVELERVAAYCEANYTQSPNNKEGAFNETKKFTIQSLASVAYQINFLSTALLRSLELETQKLVEKRCEIQNISQSVNIQKEKMARREIGKLTINKSITRQNKITYPTMEEKTPRYQRTAVDYSILDGIGHGRRVNDQLHCPSVVLLNRTGSVVSGDSLNSTNNNNNNNNPYDTQYSIFVKGGNQTLTRNSGRSIQDQYRVPQVIPSAITPPEISNHYAVHSQLQPQQNSRYSTMTNQSTRTQMMMTVPLQNDDYGTVIRGANINSLLQQQQQHLLQPQQQIQHQHFGLMGSNNNQQQNRLSMESIDGLPPPPFTMVHNEQMQQQQQQNHHHHDDPLPPPPPPPPAFSAVENHHYNHNNEFNNNNNNIGSSWIPNVYLEKARVVYGYEATRPDELTLNEEAIVYVLRKNEDGWYEGVLDGLTGLFPGNYVVPFSD